MKAIYVLLFALVLTGCASNQPPWEQVDPDKQANAYADLGVGYLEQGQLDRALRHLDRSLSIRPNNVRALHGMALTLQQQGENRQAENYFKRALRYADDKTVIRNNYAAFLFSQERYEETREQLELASQNLFYNNRALIFENLGMVALAMDDVPAARDYFLRSLALNSNNLNVHRELLRLGLDTGDLDLADRHWRILSAAETRDRESLMLGLQLAQAQGRRSEIQRIQTLLDTTQP